MDDQPDAVRYPTGEPVRAGDRVLYDGKPGVVAFVSHPDPTRPMEGFTVTLHLDSGGGVRITGVLAPSRLVRA